MLSRVARLLVLTSSLALATSGVALGQPEPSPLPAQIDSSALESLCAANAEHDAAVATCVAAIRPILAPVLDVTDVGEPELSGRIGAIIAEAVAAADGIDVQAAIDDARASLAEIDMPALIDDAVTAAQDADVGALIDEAIASAGDVDVQAIVDEIVADIEERGVPVTIEEGVLMARNVIGVAQTWITENPELVCGAGSASLGAGAAAVVGFLTESPGLALVAYRETQKAADEACGAALD